MQHPPRAHGAARAPRRWAIGLSACTVVWSPFANLVLGDTAYTLRNLVLSVVLVGAARASGLGARDLGLGRDGLRRGLVVGGLAVLAVASVIGLGVLLQDRVALVGALLADQRAVMTSAQRWAAVLLRIPLGTAMFEELLFRGVLVAAWWRVLDRRAALVVPAVLFGVWHVAPTIVTLWENGVPVASIAGATAFAGAVIATTVAGLGFSWLRWVGGNHLAAPWLAHWAINAIGLIAAGTTGGPAGG